MSEEKMATGLKEGFHGLKDPGTVLIVLYVSIVLFLLLFAGLESARADFGKPEENTVNDVHQRELLLPVQEEDRFIVTPLLSKNVPISISGMTRKPSTSPESLMFLGTILMLLALILAKDRKER
jgi:hypothetical protein